MKDAIIVGGGLLGMLTARSLHKAGLKVMIIDQGELGSESTWAGGGIVSPLYPWRYPAAVSQLARYSQQHYPTLCATLREETGVDPQWIRSGLLFAEDEEYPAAQEWAQTWGYGLQHLTTAEALATCEPQLADSFRSGLFFPELGQVRNPRIAHALRTSLRLLPVTIAEHYPVTGLETANGRVTGVRLGDEVFHADNVILTTGAWTGLFPEMQALKVDVRPVLGQMILFRGPRGLLQRIVLSQGRYLIPRKDGRILCGSTVEMRGFDKHTTAAAHAELKAAAYAIMPALRDLPIPNHWSGLRPGSPNGVPYIDEHPDIAGLYVNAGHYRNGVVLGLASVQLLVDRILGNKPCLDPSPYRLDAVRTPTAEFR
ncbi:glycine oxidase ThiO [Candidatus Thiothrix sp. Deng01]|uniref:Glycine oxidase ThiO n=1 Tax=Candidatus Thiothrix phosphatis TaxID=3112415 RepID=A0ABU6D0J4_9GAMM|nr:glycine oxidase ThiO [Candidatus Thiothrix sp. Deng01]MEB4592559.1 glycine oxidase ThiO [Candidatus Thiothrix sp. Deng01]